MLEKTSASLGGPETSGGAFGSRKLKSKPGSNQHKKSGCLSTPMTGCVLEIHIFPSFMPKISENPDTLSVGREWYGWCHARGDSEKLSSPGRVFFHHGLLEPTLDSTREATTFSDCDPECPRGCME